MLLLLLRIGGVLCLGVMVKYGLVECNVFVCNALAMMYIQGSKKNVSSKIC